jgi:anti-sigma factor RsiW
MWNNACRWARPRLALLVGGELAGDDRRRAERHLIVCGECRGRLESMRSALGALSTLSMVGATAESPSLWPALARQIRESRHPEPATFSFRPLWMGLGIAASAVAALGVASWGLGAGRAGSGGTVAARSAKPKVSAPAPVIIESGPSATVAETTPASRPENEATPPPPAPSSRKEGGSSPGRIIGVEATQ